MIELAGHRKQGEAFMNSLFHRLLAQRSPPHPGTRTIAAIRPGKTRQPRLWTTLALELLEDRTVLSPADGFSPASLPMNNPPPTIFVTNSPSSPSPTASTISTNSSGDPSIPTIPPALVGPLLVFVVDQAFLTVDTLSTFLHQNNPAFPVLQLGGPASQLQSAIQSNAVQNTVWGELGTVMGIDLGINFLSKQLQQKPPMIS
jgi:hypothetical protein